MRGLLAGTVVSTFALAGVSLMAPPVRIAERIGATDLSDANAQVPPQDFAAPEAASAPASPEPAQEPPAQEPMVPAPGDAEPPAPIPEAEPQPADRPETPIVEPPAGSEFTRERPDTEPMAPAVEPAPEAPEVASPSVPEADATPRPSDGLPAPVPEAATSIPDGIDAPTEGSESLPQAVEDENPARLGEGLDQMVDSPDASPAIDRSITQPPAIAPAPPAESGIVTPASEPAADVAQPGADLPKVIAVEPEPDTPSQDELGVQTGLTAPGNGAIRLPRIGDPVQEQAEPAEEVEQAEAPATVTALERFAVRVERADGAPVVAVVLADEPDAPMKAEEIAAIGQPVTVAVDPLAPNAAARARALRAAGLEVAILFPDMPANAAASDVEIAWQGFLEAVPEAIGIVSLPTSPLQKDRTLAQHVAELAAEDGRALVSVKRGLNAARQVAESLGVPSASIDRLLDARGESRLSIRRYLDMAALDARRSGEVVVLGRARPETVASLKAWVADGASNMVVAPVSAVLLSRQ
ncbi:polysaccharide deacetylase 2 family uncharacterized protein YibQ [Albidovulum inexpectatum]|uniref:Polysaccharide deacetylase 2 family uncharacterized protein YibQ n=2 Tax=Albidovulum inexpectatum TaxID=196587 RepID=A0A2S5JK97_9RHOB|nr:polysaccharide deacetylase 2 family uncharacterized protein YibQ [Albidovulum inexpectatum]